eukprot:s2111_g8.t1
MCQKARERRLLYEERLTILHGLKSEVEGPDANFCAAALRTLGQMSDISDDEDSPNYARIHAPDATLDETIIIAYNFVRALQSGSASSTGFSNSAQMWILCAMQLVQADIEMMQLKIQTQMRQWKLDHRVPVPEPGDRPALQSLRPPLAESAASVPSLPVTPGGFPALLDAARQQTELVFWIVRTVQEHEGRLQSLSRQLADQLSDRKAFRSSKSRNWQAGLGNRGLSRESFHSGDGNNLSQGASSPTYQDMIDPVEDKTHIEENLAGDLSHLDASVRVEAEDDALMPVDGMATVTSIEGREGDEAAEGGKLERRLSEMDLPREDRTELTRDSTNRVSTSPPARRFSFIEGGRRPSTRSLPLQVDPSFAGSLLTEERFADRLEESLMLNIAWRTFCIWQHQRNRHRIFKLQDLAQYIQEEMYHFVLGPDMMERIRQESSQVLSIELAMALAAQDKKMEELVQSRLHASLSQVPLSPPEIPPEALTSMRRVSEEMGEVTDELSKRVKLVEENVSELKGIRLQVPDMRRLLSSAADDDLTAEELQPPGSQTVALALPGPSPAASPSQLSDMLGLYMPPAQKQPVMDLVKPPGLIEAVLFEFATSRELVAGTENMKTRLDQLEQFVGTEASNRRNSLQNKINDVDTLASILEDRMRELDNEFRISNQKVQSQLDLLLAAHETQQAEDTGGKKNNRSSLQSPMACRLQRVAGLAGRLKAIRPPRPAGSQLINRRGFAEIDPGSSGVEGTSFPMRTAIVVAGTLATSAVGAASLWAWGPRGKEIDVDIKPITDEVFDNNDNLFVFYFDKAEDLEARGWELHRIMDTLVKEPSLSRVKYFQNVRKEGDPVLPGEGKDDAIRVVMYKGQRKSVLFVGDEIPKQEILDFYKPVSQDLSKLKVPKKVPMVSNASFDEDVLQASAPGRPMVLLQMFEDTCFLCFLMRPFVNSLAELLAENKAPFVLKRINIEKNDFPNNCPVARGTPTFALFRGPNVKGQKWEELLASWLRTLSIFISDSAVQNVQEFKPKDLCSKILEVFPNLSDAAFERMDELQSAVSKRFQLFTQLVMWTIELQKLESCIANTSSDGGPNEEHDFNSTLQQLMAKDMRRVDGMDENLAFLQKQVEEVEHDAVVLGIMLAKHVLAREALETVLLEVDVILSVINSEMRTLRSDFDQKLSSAILGGGKKDADSNDVPREGSREVQETKCLNFWSKYSMLKIAGLRSAHKHAEAQANFALEKLKRMQAEVGGIVDQVVMQQTRLDYLLVHGAAVQQRDGTFKAIVSVGEQEKKPKLKGGATMPTRTFEKTATQGDVAGPEMARFETTSDEVNASRIAKMGKRLLELDGEVNRTVVDLRSEIQAVNKTLLAFLELLPRRLRRMLQRQLFPEPSEEDPVDVDIKVEFKADEGKKHVTFGDHVETRTFTVEEDESRLPWQLAGEPDIKWSWCYKPRDEMGKDLAMCLEQFETERDDFEAKIVQWLQHGGVAPPVNTKAAPAWGGQSDAMIVNFAEDAMVAAPQMMAIEDRLERLGSEFFNLKRAQDNNHVRKADKEEVQQLLARLTFFEKLNIPDLKIRIESLEGDTKFAAQNASDMAEKLYKVEAVAVPRSELVKVQNGFEDLRSDHQAMKVELKEMSATTYNSNRKFVHEMAEAKAWTQQAIVGLQKSKADGPDLAQLSEKVGKLEYSIKDNRRILGDGGGQEINAVVRRIILNLEDKIMVLEKKIDAMADGRPKDALRSKEDISPSHQQSASYQSTEMQEAAVQSISEELSVMTEAVSKLKQDISVSKVHIDEMTEQVARVSPAGPVRGERRLPEAERMRSSFLQRLEAGVLVSFPDVPGTRMVLAQPRPPLSPGSPDIAPFMTLLTVTVMQEKLLQVLALCRVVPGLPGRMPWCLSKVCAISRQTFSEKCFL